MAIDQQDVPGRGEPGPISGLPISTSKTETFNTSTSDVILDDVQAKKARSVTSRIDVFEASSFMDDSNTQLESLHRQVFALAKQSRARSAVPWNSMQRSRMQKAIINEMEDEAMLSQFDIDITGKHVKALTGRHPGTNRRQISDLMHRLRDADAIGVYARRQGLRFVNDINEQIANLTDKIEKRMAFVDHDDRMPRSKASQRRAHWLAVLDDRLDKSRRWNNELRTQNAALRQDIEGLNLERRTDLAILARLGDAVVEQRAAIRSLLDGMQQAEVAQMAALAELGPLEIQYRAESQRFAADWAQTAELDERHRALEEEIIRMKGEMYFGDGQKIDIDDQVHEMVSRTAWRIGQDKAMLQAVSERHQLLHDLVHHLYRLTNTTDIDEIVARFERADTDQLVQYGTLQSLIMELAELKREDKDVVTCVESRPGSRSSMTSSLALPRVVPDPEQLEHEAGRLREIFTSMTDMMVNMMEILHWSGVSICSEAVLDSLSTIGVTAQNVDMIVSGLEDDIQRLLDRWRLQFHLEGEGHGGTVSRSNSRDPMLSWKDPDLIEDSISVILPCIHQQIDDDDTDIR